MAMDLELFGIREQLRCATLVQDVGHGHGTFEGAARRLCRSFYDELQTSGATPSRACALVRCYKTHPFASLPPDLQRFARTLLPGGERPAPGVRCLTLMATVGDQPAWNSRHESRGHKAIPLPGPEMVEKAPMIAQLVRDFGLDLADVVNPAAIVMRDRRGKNYGVFHVEQASGSPAIPAQVDFVHAHGIRSVVGFGGSLATGDIFAIVLFTRVRVSAEVADRFRAVALNVKSAFFGFAEHEVFEAAAPASDAARSAGVSA